MRSLPPQAANSANTMRLKNIAPILGLLIACPVNAADLSFQKEPFERELLETVALIQKTAQHLRQNDPRNPIIHSGYGDCVADGHSYSDCFNAGGGYGACIADGRTYSDCFNASTGYGACVADGHTYGDCFNASGGYGACVADGHTYSECFNASEGYAACVADGHPYSDCFNSGLKKKRRRR